MKNSKLHLVLVMLFSSIIAFGQDGTSLSESDFITPIAEREHELKIGAISLLSGPAINIEYEKILNRYTSFGGVLGLNMGEALGPYDFALNSFYRMYFTESKEYGSKGFFAQANAGVYTGDGYSYNAIEEENYTVGGAGFGIGRKWTNGKGFIFQVVLGVNRSIGGGNTAPEGFFLGDVYMGYRF